MAIPILQKALKLLTGDTKAQATRQSLKLPKLGKRPFRKLTIRDLIELESEIGKELFGPVPEGHRREFFNLDDRTWIWHEEFLTASGELKAITTRYEIQEKGILKAQDGAQYTYVDGEELTNLVAAMELYYERVAREIYGREPKTGDPRTS